MRNRVAVIGCGRWGTNLVRSFAQLSALACVCDTLPKRAEQMAEQYGVLARAWSDILADKTVGSVAIAAPSHQHAALALEALEAGKHVFVEKPMAMHVSDARRLCQKAQQCGLCLMAGHIMRYHPAFLCMKSLIESGVIGPILSITTQRANWGRVHGQPNSYDGQDDVLWDLGPHDIALILDLLAPAMPDCVAAWGCSQIPGIYDDVHARLSFEKAYVHLHVSWLGPEKKRLVQVAGKGGTLIFDDTQPWEKKLTLYTHHLEKDEKVFTPAGYHAIHVPPEEPLINECASFLTISPEEANGQEGLNVLSVLNQIRQTLPAHTPAPVVRSATSLSSDASHTILQIDLAHQQKRIRPQLDQAISRVLDHGQYILGPEVDELEARLQTYCGVKHAVTCSDGTTALVLGLMALGVRPGDAVFVPSFTFIATIEAVILAGATPVLVDVLEDTYTLDPHSLEKMLACSREKGLTPVGVIPVDLFGQPANYDHIEAVCQIHGLWIIADAAQSFGAAWREKKVGTLGRIACTSFFPSKPLGCYGDGGALFTNDDDLNEKLRALRNHGTFDTRLGAHAIVGMTARLDSIQAAILLEKMALIDEERTQRGAIAAGYASQLSGEAAIRLPYVAAGAQPCWALYTLRLNNVSRDDVVAHLTQAGIQVRVYYKAAIHHQPTYSTYALGQSFPVSASLASSVLTLPLSCSMTQADVAYVCRTLLTAVHASSATQPAVGLQACPTM